MDFDLVQTIVSGVAALGTVGALALSITTLRSQLQQRRQEQASRVSVEVSDAPLAAVVHNASELPIFHVLVMAVGTQDRTYLSHEGAEILRPNESRSLPLLSGFERISRASAALGSAYLLHRGRIELEKALAEAFHAQPDDQSPGAALYEPAVVFTDGQGIRWERTATGGLKQIRASAGGRRLLAGVATRADPRSLQLANWLVLPMPLDTQFVPRRR